LYGFIQDDNKYFYIIESFHNYHGVIDETGRHMVQYSCDAYGNIIRTKKAKLIGYFYYPIRY